MYFMLNCFLIFYIKGEETLEYSYLDFTKDHIILFSSFFVDSNLVLVSSASLNNLKPEDILKLSDFIRCLLEGE